jgi:hypothetical protein
LASEIGSSLPMYTGRSRQTPYATFGVPEIPITPGSGPLGGDGVHMPMGQPLGHTVFQPSGIPEGNILQSQMPLPIAGDGGAYRTRAVMPETMWPGQGVSQELMTQILQMMESSGGGKWPSGLVHVYVSIDVQP